MGCTARTYASQLHALATNGAKAILGFMKMIKGLEHNVMRDSQYLNYFCGPSPDLFQHVPVSIVLESPTVHSRCASLVLGRKEKSLSTS